MVGVVCLMLSFFGDWFYVYWVFCRLWLGVGFVIVYYGFRL